MSTTLLSKWTVAAARNATKAAENDHRATMICNKMIPGIDAAIERGADEGRYFAEFLYVHACSIDDGLRTRVKARLEEALYPGFHFKWDSQTCSQFAGTISWNN